MAAAEGTRAATGRVPLAALVACALAWPVAARAYRPFDSTDAAVADRGEVEIELGPVGYLAQGSHRAIVAPNVVLNWGFADRWELVLEGENVLALGADPGEPRFVLDETILSAKHVLREGSLQGKPGVSVAVEPGVLLPTVNGEPGAGLLVPVIVSQRWPDLTIHLNAWAEWTRAHQPGVFGGVILEGHDAWTVRPVAEAWIEAERGAPPTVSGLLGTIWRARKDLSLDAGVRLARTGGVATVELRLGLTWGFAVGRPR